MLTGSATVDPTYPIHNSMGAVLIAIVVSAVLHGICLLQASQYFRKFPNDRTYLRIMVVSCVSFDAVHLGLITHSLYHYLVTFFGNREKMLTVVPSIVIEVIFAGMNAGIVQAYFCYRVWRLSKGNLLLTGFFGLIILGNTGAGVVWTVLAMQAKTYEGLLKITPLTITINVMSVVADIGMAATLCILLHQARTGFRRSDSVITKLILFCVNTGMITSSFALAALLSIVFSPNSLLYAVFYFNLGRLYTNSLLATLNSRASIRSMVDEATGDSHAMHPVTSSAGHTLGRSKTPQPGISIRIDTTTQGGESEEELPTMDKKREV